MQDYHRLGVWEKAHELALEVYSVTAGFPAEERFGLTAQLRRSAASIPANIAEGSARSSDRDFARFLTMALGSLAETDYHTLLAHDLRLVETTVYGSLESRLAEVRRMLISLRKIVLSGSQLKAEGS